MGWTFECHTSETAPTLRAYGEKLTTGPDIFARHMGREWKDGHGNHCEYWYMATFRAQTVIGLLLLSKRRDGRLWQIGHKSMDATMGPFYHSCPLAWTKRDDLHRPAWAEKHLRDWIKRVEEYHAHR